MRNTKDLKVCPKTTRPLLKGSRSISRNIRKKPIKTKNNYVKKKKQKHQQGEQE